MKCTYSTKIPHIYLTLVVLYRNKASFLKLLNQWQPNFGEIVFNWSPVKLCPAFLPITKVAAKAKLSLSSNTMGISITNPLVETT